MSMNVFEMRARVTEGDIALLVGQFYEAIQAHPVLGPVFATRIEPEAWPEHLAKMRSFWETALLGTGSYRGNPMAAHQTISAIRPEHFNAWLGLFRDVAEGVFDEDVAAAILRRAERMAESLTIGIELTRGRA